MRSTNFDKNSPERRARRPVASSCNAVAIATFSSYYCHYCHHCYDVAVALWEATGRMATTTARSIETGVMRN